VGEETERKLAELKKYLENRIRELSEELELLKLSLRMVDEALSKVSFKTAEQLMEKKPKEVEAPVVERKEIVAAVPEKVSYEREIPILSRDGVLLGKVYVARDHLRIVPEQGMEFDVSSPPFKNFVIAKVLKGMREKDMDRVFNGQLELDKAIEFDYSTDDRNNLKELVVKNYRDENRLREIVNAVRWAFRILYEKKQRGA